MCNQPHVMKLQFPAITNKKSFIVLVILALCILITRILTLTSNELSWDVFGYYIHLPAFFIYHDYGLNNTSWIYDLMGKYPLTGTLYQLSTGPENNPIFFFLMGMAIFYLPWFAIAHVLVQFSGYPADGFSLPYQYSLAVGAVVYTIIGLIYLRKILIYFFNDNTAAIVLAIIVLATNYFHFMTIKNLETANILFLMVTLITWNTIQWHNNFKLKNLIAISAFIVLAALSKPSEVIITLLPLLWGVYDKQSLKNKLNLIAKYKSQVFIALIIAVLIALPQVIYWYKETGRLLYDSYKNPGVGLDLDSPHIFNVLFSFKKGWLIYTPVMIFAILGFFPMYKKNRGVFTPILVYSLIAFYIISSWTEWWYGASFSIRPMITLYPLLAIALGYFINYLLQLKSRTVISGIAVVILFFLALNLFQTWQLKHYIIEPYRMTQKYYFAIFGKTKVKEEYRNLLAPDLTFSDGAKIGDLSLYNHKNIGAYDFEDYNDNYSANIVVDSLKGKVLRMDSTLSFSPEIRTTFRGITNKDYAWIRAKADVFIPKGYKNELPLLVMTFDRKGGSYYYHSYGVDTNVYKPGTWGEIKVDLLTPNVRSRNDYFKVYVWNRGNAPVLIDNIKAEVFEPK